MIHIIYWDRDVYVLTSSVLVPDEEVIINEDLPKLLNGKGVVLTVGKNGVPVVSNKQIAGMLDDLLPLIPNNEPLYVVYPNGKVEYSINIDSPIEELET